MKDPCIGCPDDKTRCRTSVCAKWEAYIMSYQDRNNRQTRLTQYWKTEEVQKWLDKKAKK